MEREYRIPLEAVNRAVSALCVGNARKRSTSSRFILTVSPWWPWATHARSLVRKARCQCLCARLRAGGGDRLPNAEIVGAVTQSPSAPHRRPQHQLERHRLSELTGAFMTEPSTGTTLDSTVVVATVSVGWSSFMQKPDSEA